MSHYYCIGSRSDWGRCGLLHVLLSLSAACHPLGVTSQLPAGQTCSVGVGLLPAAHQYPMYLQLAGNLSCPLGGTHINCAAVKMSKKIKIFFVVARKPTAHLALLSILEGLCGWMDGSFFLTIISTIYLSFLVSIRDITGTSEKLGKLDSRFKGCCFISIFCFLIPLPGRD